MALLGPSVGQDLYKVGKALADFSGLDYTYRAFVLQEQGDLEEVVKR